MPKFMWVALGVATVPLRAAAQAPELVTDRPDFTESPIAVPKGSVQIELGSTWERAGGESTVSGPETLVRWGATRALELRFGLPDYVRAQGRWTRSETPLGVKLPLSVLAPSGWDLALIETVWLNLGSVLNDSPFAEIILTTGRDLGERASFGSQVATVLGTGDSDNRVDFAATVVIGLGLTDRLSTFSELAVDAFEEEYRAFVFHHGYSWLASPLVQLDFHVALGLNEYAPDAQIGLGLATRLGG